MINNPFLLMTALGFSRVGIRSFQRRSRSFALKSLAIFAGLISVASASVPGDFTYVVEGTVELPTVTITGHPAVAVGPVVIPGTIEGLHVTKIGNDAFANQTQMTSVTIPPGVTMIGNSSFYSCVALTNVTLPSSLRSIGTYAFFACQQLTCLSLPEGLNTINPNAFYLCRGLASINIPSTVTSLGNGIFYNCSALTSVTIPAGITTISPGLFFSCSALTSVTIPSTVTSIGFEAFRYCSALTSLTIPSSVTTFGTRAFANCRGLTGFSISASVTSIGTDPFIFCSALTTISVDANNPSYSSIGGVVFNKLQTTLIAFPPGVVGAYTVPSNVNTIGVKAFFTADKITRVTFPATLTSVGSSAFESCSALLEAIFTGDAPTSIGANAFILNAMEFSIYYLGTSQNFSTPFWNDYPAELFNGGSNPISNWLTSHQLPVNSDMGSDENRDGVSLLMAYALNLNPNLNLSGSTPQLVKTATQTSLSFYGVAPGITYSVECSTNLADWSTAGVTLSSPDINQIRTATVSTTGPSCFMRLKVSQ
jgi:hypothetical protein